MKIKQIFAAIKTRKEFKEELTELQIKRLKECSKCPFLSSNKKKKNLKDKWMLFLNKALNFIFRIPNVKDTDICTDCGCDVIFKSTQEAEDLICQQKKWNNL
jgi:hypothetical protein